ncbi:hypothetical protein [Pseudonocardia sp. DLS-67]
MSSTAATNRSSGVSAAGAADVVGAGVALGVLVARVVVVVAAAEVVVLARGLAIPAMTMIATIVPKIPSAILAGLGTTHRLS